MLKHQTVHEGVMPDAPESYEWTIKITGDMVETHLIPTIAGGRGGLHIMQKQLYRYTTKPIKEIVIGHAHDILNRISVGEILKTDLGVKVVVE